MDLKPSISIAVLEQALAATKDRISTLEAEADDLRRAIHKLQARDGAKEKRALTLSMDGETAEVIISRQEEAVENNEQYPPAKFIGVPRIDIAIALAGDFDGYLATGALRKILLKPGVLKNTRNVFSLASRIPANSEFFTRIWEGLYRLKSRTEEQVSPMGNPPERDTGVGPIA